MINKKNTVILVALEQELPNNYLPGWTIIYTGVGKVNASFAISKSYYDYKPNSIYNTELCLDLLFKIEDLYTCRRIIRTYIDVLL